MRDYTKIIAFVKADDLVMRVYEVTQDWPKDELYGLTSQIRRASVSVAANIVEGSGRRYQAEYLKFLSISNGSLREVGYYIHLAKRLGYMNDEEHAKIQRIHEEASRVLWGLIQTISTQLGQQPLANVVREDYADYKITE